MLWDDCDGTQPIRPISGKLFRMVESQEQVATLSYVDTLEEQALLEEMLESSKPALPVHSGNYHYLLKTPFRYPPLPWGSRFGRSHEPAIFYGASSVDTTLAESAYYRLVFWHSMDAVPVKQTMRSEHSLFSAQYLSSLGLKLQLPPCSDYETQLSHPQQYTQPQLLGSAMRKAGVEAFEYRSARDPKKGSCVGLFTPAALRHRRPQEMTQWLCEVSVNEVAFKQVGQTDVFRFGLEIFLYQGELPLPSA
ncbi:MAG: RES family NAD+ phosphorylase [Gammaproteobacteria bacterium]|nr:RES family NAD+ phosphorylase [Gammaproteobacteria bacterium]